MIRFGRFARHGHTRLHQSCLAVMIALGCGLLANSADAQTLTRTADWEQPGATVPEAQSYAYTLKIDSNAPILLTQTCAAVASATRCTAPLAASLLTPGTHTLVLTASNSFGSASSAALTGTPPTGPVTFKLTFTISIP